MIDEEDCASGTSPAGRLLPPIVAYKPTTITITVPVMPLPGPQTCQGNPEYPLTVNLTEPVGERAIVGGSLPSVSGTIATLTPGPVVSTTASAPGTPSANSSPGAAAGACSLDHLASQSGLAFSETGAPDPGVRQTVEDNVAQMYPAARIVELVKAVGAGESAPILDRTVVAVVMALANTPSPAPGASMVDADRICAAAFYDAASGEWLTTVGGDGIDQLGGKVPFEYVISNIDGPPVRASVNGVAIGSPVVCNEAGLVLTATVPGVPPLPWQISVATLDGAVFGSGSADGTLAKVLFVRRDGVMEQAEPGNPGPGPELPCPTAPAAGS